MNNRSRDALGHRRQTQPGATSLVKVTLTSNGARLVVSSARIDRIESHRGGSRILFDDGTQMIVNESLDDIIEAAR